MFDSKMLLVILAIALVIFGTKRLRSIGSDLGAAVKGFKQAMNDGESEEKVKQLKQDKDADFDAGAATREAEVKVPPKTNARCRMLDVGFSEILLTSAIALIVLAPERLPKVARQVGNWMGRARAMARQLSERLAREVNAEELLKAQSKIKSGTPVPAPPVATAVPAEAAP